MRHIPILLFILLLPACSGKQTHPAAGQRIDLSGIWDKPAEIMLSSIADDIEYIPLETSPECLLGDAGSLRVTVLNQYIVLHSKGLRLFNRQGKYLRPIGGIGKGPREYASSGCFIIDETNGRVDILDDDRHRVVSFRVTGEFIGDFRVADHAAKITRDHAGRIGILYLPDALDVQDTARFEWFSEEGKRIKSIPLYVGRPKDGGGSWLIAANLYWEREKLVFGEWPFDTLYYLKNDQAWKPLWIPLTGPNKMPREVSLSLDRWSAERSTFTSLFLSLETSRFLFFSAERKGSFGIVCYDKVNATGKWKPVISADEVHYDCLTNDLDGGLNVSYGSSNISLGDNYVNLISPIDLMANIKPGHEPEIPASKPELRKKLFQMVDQLHEDDNPVVMVVKLKTKAE